METSYILIAGGSGLIGRKLSDYLYERGYQVGVLTRSPKLENDIYWDPNKKKIDLTALEKVTHLINLSGASIGEKRWTEERKKELLSSRIDPIQFLYESALNMPRLRHFICASGVSCYGFDDVSKSYQEDDVFGKDFLSQIVQKWEAAADLFATKCMVTKVRISPVIDNDGGFLQKMKQPIQFGMGAIIGTGAQWIPWIYWKDLVRMFEFIIKNKQVGVFNAVANNTTNKEFTTTLAHSMHRKIFLPAIPSFMMRLLLGEQATLVLDGVKISNDKIRLSGFEFSFTDLKKVLEKL
jgi:uncharacterized protein